MINSDNFDSEKALTSSGYLVIAFIGALATYTEKENSQWPLVALVGTSIFISFAIFMARDSSLSKRRMFWVIGVLIALFLILVETNIVVILTIVWVVQAAELYGPRRAALLAFVSLSTFLLSQIYHSGLENLFSSMITTVLYGLFQVFALSVVQRGIRERTLREETALLNRELLATRELLSQTTAQAERVRIARNLHDILGHHMTALILNLEVANHSIRRSNENKGYPRNDVIENKDKENEGGNGGAMAQEKIEQALALAKLLLGDIRTAVSELREDDRIDLKRSIEKLTYDIPDLKFDIDCSAAPPINSVLVAEILLRCSQESITNVIRHSGANLCRVSIAEVRGQCVLSITDNGTTNAEIVAGNGIRGMQERVTAIGGKMNWQSSTEGFSLQIEVPLGLENED